MHMGCYFCIPIQHREDVMDLDAIVKRAQAKVQKKAARAAEKMAQDKKVRAQAIEENRRKKEAAARQVKQVSGFDMAETFLQEIAEPFLRMMRRGDAGNLEGIRIVLMPYKTDHGPYSMHIENPFAKKGVARRFPNASIQQLAEKQGWQSERLIRKLEQFGGFNCSSQAEMLDEIFRLREALQASHVYAKQLQEQLASSKGGDEMAHPPTDEAVSQVDETAEATEAAAATSEELL
jgi:hypothetical protein